MVFVSVDEGKGQYCHAAVYDSLRLSHAPSSLDCEEVYDAHRRTYLLLGPKSGRSTRSWSGRAPRARTIELHT